MNCIMTTAPSLSVFWPTNIGNNPNLSSRIQYAKLCTLVCSSVLEQLSHTRSWIWSPAPRWGWEGERKYKSASLQKAPGRHFKNFIKHNTTARVIECATNCFYPNILTSSADDCFPSHPVQQPVMLVVLAFTDCLRWFSL